MPLNASAPEKTFEVVPAQTYGARCIGVIDLGTHMEQFQGEDKETRKVRIVWELNDKDKEGKYRVIGQDYSLYLSEKANLRKMLDAWRGKQFSEDELKSFDLFSVIGAKCTLGVANKKSAKGNTYAVVSTVSPLMKGIELPEQTQKTLSFSFDDFPNDMPERETKLEVATKDFQKFILDKIKTADEWETFAPGVNGSKDVATIEYPDEEINPEDIPF